MYPAWTIIGLPYCVCIHPIDFLSIHLLWCSLNNEHIRTHDAICDVFASIAKEVGFYVDQEQLHIIPSSMF
jgi:hypothetical protein